MMYVTRGNTYSSRVVTFQIMAAAALYSYMYSYRSVVPVCVACAHITPQTNPRTCCCCAEGSGRLSVVVDALRTVHLCRVQNTGRARAGWGS